MAFCAGVVGRRPEERGAMRVVAAETPTQLRIPLGDAFGALVGRRVHQCGPARGDNKRHPE